MKRLITLATLFALVCTVTRADQYDTLRARWLETLVGPTSFTTDTALNAQLSTLATAVASNGTSRDTTSGTGYWDTMNTAAGRTYLWSDLNSSTISAYITAAYSRLRAMAIAYGTAGCALQGNTTLRSDIIAGLDWLYSNRYNETITSYDNWWDWQIGTPVALNDLTVILYSSLTSTEIANYMAAINHWTPSPSMTGANRMWTTKVTALCGVIAKNSSKLDSAASGIVPIFAFVTSSDGFYTDGSFVQHTGQPYNGGYGLQLIQDLTDYIYLYAGTTWAVSSANQATAYGWLYDSFEPILYKGEVMDMVRGRIISRYDEPTHLFGKWLESAFLRATQIAPSSDAAYYKRAIKYWLQSDTTFTNAYSDFSIDDIILAEAIMNDSGVTSRGELVSHYSFPGMARVIHLRPGWGAGLAMHSNRIDDYESGNDENLKGWHTGFGMLYLYNSDELQYSGNYWPTVDPYRLAGTTVEASTTVSPNEYASTTFAGGVESYGMTSGVAGMDLAPYNRTLRGKKAWFFFDNEVVCLGAGITATSGATLETVVENRKLTSAGTNSFLVNNASAVSSLQTMPGTPQTLSGVNYAFLGGNVSGSDVGYYFPGGATLQAMREQRTGTWHSINTGPNRTGNTTVQTNNFLELWFSHGVNPGSASYAYAILPGITSAALQTYASAPDFTVLENSTAAQAVQKSSLSDSVAALFWASGSKTVGSGTDAITSDSPGAVYTSTGSTLFNVTLADPTRSNTGTINLAFAKAATSVASNDPSINVTQLSPTIQLSFNPGATHGMPQRISFNLGSSGTSVQAQAETLVSRGSGATSADFADANLSGGLGNWLNATTAAGSPYVEYDVTVPSSGTWDITVAVKKHPSYGTFQASITQAGANLGAAQDLYAAAVGYATIDLGTYAFSTSGTKTFRFTVTGKNAASANYYLAFDYLLLTKH